MPMTDGTTTQVERSPHDEFMEADAEFSKLMREFNEISDRVWAATKRRQAAWRALRDRNLT